MKPLLSLALLAGLSACAVAPPPTEFLASKKSAVQLRSIQTREIDANEDTTMRAVIGTLHDLGYRITRVEEGADTVSATRETALRIAVVVRPKTPTVSIVRANATVVTVGKEAQVDSPEFYLKDFFDPLGATMHRQLTELANDESAPDAARPVAEIDTAEERKALATAAVHQNAPTKGNAGQ